MPLTPTHDSPAHEGRKQRYPVRGAEDPPVVGPVRWVWLAAVPIVSLFILSNAATVLYAVWQRDMGFSQSTLTWIFAIYIVGLLASLLIAGPVSDRIGRKPVLLPALALSVAGCVILLIASSVPALLAARLMTGVAVGAVVSCGMAAVADIAGPHRRRLAALLSSSAMVFGSGLGPLFAGLVANTAADPVTPVFGTVLVLLLVSLLIVTRMPLRPQPRREGPLVRLPSVPREQLIHLVLGICVFAPGLSGGSFFLSLGPSLLYEMDRETSTATAGSLVFATFTAATLVQFAARRTSLLGILTGGSLSTVAGMAALYAAASEKSPPLLFVAAVLIGTGQGAGQFAGFTLLNTAVPAHRLAAANSSLSVGAYLPAALLSLTAGVISDAAGVAFSAMTLATGLAITAAAGATAITLGRDRIPPV
jgi:predicted MFS family arabinose efflux permease